MFGIFKKKTELDKLEKEYKQLLEEAFKLSTSNRSASDAKQNDAQQILDKIDAIRAKEAKV
ncbi:Lacal_2735 family protein [Aurantibacter sp.]|uniref:Lacal_2735 family protein n=1 Tax=Aurantibacter sp. TaxID=2807103 RepID=UPI0035C83673